MTLTAHAIVGAGIMAAIPAHPVLGISLAFASHFLVDAIPHYDYQIRSDSIHPLKGTPLQFDIALLLDFFSIGSDFALGIILGFFFFAAPTTWPLVVLAAFAGQLPDALQFVYTRFKHEPLVSLLRFHHWIHTTHRLREYPMLGVVSQICFLVAFIAGIKIVF